MIQWKRSKSGVYTSSDGRWHIWCIGKRNEWRLQDCKAGKGKCRYYWSLSAAKDGAERHDKD